MLKLKTNKAQGTIEYLVILGIVVIIGLVVVSISTGFFDSASGVATTSRDIDRITASGIVVREAILDYEGEGLFSLNNNTGQTLTLTKISSGEEENTFNKQITSGSTEVISLKSLDITCPCGPGQTTNTCTFDIYYTSRYGIEQKITQTINVECEENFTPSNPEQVTPPESTFLTQNCFDQSQDPIPICTLNDLNKIRENLTRSYILKADIDATDTINWNDGQGWEPLGWCGPNDACLYGINYSGPPYYGYTFTGKFNGNNYRIRNLYINKNSKYSGLFGTTHESEIKNIGLTDANITGTNTVGGLVGYNLYNTVISQSYATGEINCSRWSCGGLVGRNYGNIIKSFSKVNIISEGPPSQNTFIGGLVGFHFIGDINKAYFIGNVTGESQVGGLIGRIFDGGSINNSYSSGTVQGDSTIGGLVGYSETNITIKNSFSNSKVLGNSNTDGFIGWANDTTTLNSYWDITVSEIGEAEENNYGAIGKTTAQMTYNYNNEDTFSEWDFDTIWAHDTTKTINNGYPYLKWQTE